MTYAIRGLSPAPFAHLFGLPDDALAAHRATRHVVNSLPGYPDRVTLRDAPVGSTVLLVHHTHQPADTPYHASHAIFVGESDATPWASEDELPPMMRSRLLSLRAFDAGHMMVDADIAEGPAVEPLIARLLADPQVAYLHAHFARRGCFAARIDRWPA